jgi:hypothetical protein
VKKVGVCGELRGPRGGISGTLLQSRVQNRYIRHDEGFGKATAYPGFTLDRTAATTKGEKEVDRSLAGER